MTTYKILVLIAIICWALQAIPFYSWGRGDGNPGWQSPIGIGWLGFVFYGIALFIGR